MKRLLAVAAVLGASGLTLYAAYRDGISASDPVATTRQLVAWMAARDNAVPPPGQCWDAEVVADDDSDDAGRTRHQRAWTLCNLPGDDTFAVDLPRRCRTSARALCYESQDDGGTDDVRTEAERHCFRRSVEACNAALQQAGGVVWHSAARDALPTDKALDRLSRREQMTSSCACRNEVDAGMCRRLRQQMGVDSGTDKEPAPYDLTLAAGTWSGAGCVAAPCVHSEVRETENLYPEPCR